MSAYELAQLNIASMKEPLESPRMADFVANLKYVYESAHVEIMRRRKEWFERMREAYVVLWWVPRGHRPDVSEAIARLELLRAKGPTKDAFTFRQAFLPPDAVLPGAPYEFGDECPAT